MDLSLYILEDQKNNMVRVQQLIIQADQVFVLSDNQGSIETVIPYLQPKQEVHLNPSWPLY